MLTRKGSYFLRFRGPYKVSLLKAEQSLTCHVFDEQMRLIYNPLQPETQSSPFFYMVYHHQNQILSRIKDTTFQQSFKNMTDKGLGSFLFRVDLNNSNTNTVIQQDSFACMFFFFYILPTSGVPWHTRHKAVKTAKEMKWLTKNREAVMGDDVYRCGLEAERQNRNFQTYTSTDCVVQKYPCQIITQERNFAAVEE